MKKVKKTRSEQKEENRRALLEAAWQVVGEYGLPKTSIARITERANLAQGSFYTYFDSRQNLFEELPSAIVTELQDYLRDRVKGSKDFMEVEEKGFRAFFEFLEKYPGYFRIGFESETVSPDAYIDTFKNNVDHYVHSLNRSSENGEIRGYELRELEVIAIILMAVRYYFHIWYVQYGKSDDGSPGLPEWAIQTYLKFVRAGLNAIERE
jgi:AcrR family transcriptional regulator